MPRLPFLLITALAAVPAFGDVLYTNGAVNGFADAFFVSTSFIVSDSFTLSQDSTVVGVTNIGIWVAEGGTPTSFDWTISTDQLGGGTVLASGSGFDTSTELIADNGTGGNRAHDAVWAVGFSLNNVTFDAGTYWLTLANATGTNAVRWDATVGPSSAVDEHVGSGTISIVSESFEIDGPDIGTPEPASYLLLAFGLAAVFVLKSSRMRLSK
ncbi:MAG: PEP-CTERM sorting domain-containing protein [Acidobacteriia bacterium]|nr:PEP-CTERM sorting domain-containing protein [Terriglobia bacterium]